MSEGKNETPLTFEKFVGFYYQFMEPRFERIENKLIEHDLKFEQVDRRFEDLYKKFEDLHQEYIFANVQIKRLTDTCDGLDRSFKELEGAFNEMKGTFVTKEDLRKYFEAYYRRN